MTYNIIAEPEYISKENYLKQVIENVIVKSNFTLTNQFDSFYFTNNNNYIKTIKSIDPSKNPSTGLVFAVGQFLYINNKYSIVLNYENQSVYNNLESKLTHEITHVDNHLTFSKNEKLKAILDKLINPNSLTIFEIFTFKALNMIDEYIATRNEILYDYSSSFIDFNQKLVQEFNLVNKTFTNKKIKIQKDEIAEKGNRIQIVHNNFSQLFNFLSILPYVLPLQEAKDLFPVISNSHINSFIPKLKKLLEETYQNYLNDKTSIILGVENLRSLLFSLLDEILGY